MSITPLDSAGPGSVAPAKPHVPVTSGTATTAPVPGGAAHASPQYPTPAVTLDPTLNTVILEYRDAGTGAEVSQIPSKEQIRLYELGQQHAVQPTVPGAPPTLSISGT